MSEHELEAGRELDALIAGRVFGLVPCAAWKRVNFGSAGGPALANEGCEHGKRGCYPIIESSGMFGAFGGPARYSTEIRHAWGVVEAVATKTKWYALCYRPTGAACNFMGDTRSEVLATFEECDGSREKAQALAICRAALKAIG